MPEPEGAGTTVSARYFDGRSAVAHAVSLALVDGRLVVLGTDVHRTEPIEAIAVSERIGRTPRFVRFPDNAHCEVTDVDALARLLREAATPMGMVAQFEHSSRIVFGVVIALAALAAVGYLYGIPMAADVIAKRLPPTALNRISGHTLQLLDSVVFEPTALPVGRQQALRQRLAGFVGPRAQGRYRLQFRASTRLGANALALPNGTLVVTDELVALAASDSEILAVLAHEAGHVEERHGLRNVIQSSVISGFVYWYLGDVNALIAAAPTLLMQAKYSRDLEREADRYAVRLLRENGMSGEVLARMLEKLERDATGDADGGDGEAAYLSSHPTTRERLEELRAMR